MVKEAEECEILKDASRKSYRFSVMLPIIFGITAFTMVIGANLIAFWTSEEMGDIFFYTTISIGLGIIVINYIINWIYCMRYIKRMNNINEIEDIKLKRLLYLYKISCVLFMIPITFLIGMIGFQKVKVFSRGTYRKGTLDEIIYKYLIVRD